jgi:hypothetical protein
MTRYPSVPSMPDTQRCASLCAVLPWPLVCSHTDHQEPVTFVRLRVAPVSLCAPRRERPLSRTSQPTECLLTSTRSRAQLYKRGKDALMLRPPNKDSAFLPSRERRRASCLGSGDKRYTTRCQSRHCSGATAPLMLVAPAHAQLCYGHGDVNRGVATVSRSHVRNASVRAQSS